MSKVIDFLMVMGALVFYITVMLTLANEISKIAPYTL